LFAAGATLVALTLPGCGTARARVARYPRRKVAALSALQTGQPIAFRYPWDHPNCDSVLVKLGRQAAGGVGGNQDIVAFNGLCPHMGWELPAELFHADPGIAGPCPGHWTTFDLTRHGMVVSGHATQGLPQILLEVEGGDVFATGVLGLMFGFSDNTVAPHS
jgi:arsenite oxidase small subunit